MSTKAINNSSSNPVLDTPKSRGLDRLAESRKTSKSDSVDGLPKDSSAASSDWELELSPEAKEKAKAHQKALNIARNTPDVREDKIAELKKKIQAGTYEIDSGKIADGILREAAKDKLAES